MTPGDTRLIQSYATGQQVSFRHGYLRAERPLSSGAAPGKEARA